MRAGKRISSRYNKKKGRGIFKFVILASLCGVLVAGGYSLWHSSLVQIGEVVFYGNKYLSEEELMTLMETGKDRNLLSLSLRRLARSFSASPWIKSVSLRKEYPRRLLVRIEEAVPVALLESGREIFLVDDEGNVLEKLKGQSVPFLPVISGGLNRNPDTYLEAIYLAKVVKDTGLAAEKDRIGISGIEGGADDLTLSVDGLVVKVGEGQYEEKLSRLFELSDEIKRKGIAVDYIDLRFANRVVVKPVAEVLR